MEMKTSINEILSWIYTNLTEEDYKTLRNNNVGEDILIQLYEEKLKEMERMRVILLISGIDQARVKGMKYREMKELYTDLMGVEKYSFFNLVTYVFVFVLLPGVIIHCFQVLTSATQPSITNSIYVVVLFIASGLLIKRGHVFYKNYIKA